MRTLPVAETSGMRRSCISASPIVGPEPATRFRMPSGRSLPFSTGHISCSAAMALRAAFEDGFQTTVSPHTRAIKAFQDHTASGKLKAVITPTGPSGCHCS